MLTATLRLATAGLLTSAVAATLGEAAASKAPLSPVMEGQSLLLPAADRTRMPSTPRDVRGPPIGIPGGPGVQIFIPPGLVPEKKPKIPAPVYKQCVPAQKVGKVVVTLMSKLPPPGICNGKQVAATTSVIGSYGKEPGIYPDSGAKHVTHNYCVACKYDGDFVDPKKFSNLSFIYVDTLKNFSCLRCPNKYVWSAAKKKCCPN